MKTLLLLGLSLVVACGGAFRIDDDGSDGGAGVDGGKGDVVVTDTVVTPRIPKNHRPTATPCDQTRPDTEPTGGRPDASVNECQKNADCTSGKNGRCSIEGRTGRYYCTYDACFSDAECGGGVCACGGSNGSDANACTKGTCQVDGDCGGNYCSPSLGSCGHYMKPVGYFCHTQADECIDDSDCSAGDCRYEPAAGKWKCSTQECAG